MTDKNQIDISQLINSERYQKVLEEISSTIDQRVQDNPFSEPLLCSSIGDNEALQLLEKETQQNQEQFNDLYQIYQEIIEDTLYTQLELIPLEQKRDEMWKSLNNSTFAKLLERYSLLKREEASIIYYLRNELENPSPSGQSLQASCHSIQDQNQKIKKEIKTLDSQLKRYKVELEQEKQKAVQIIDDNDPELIAGRQLAAQIQEINQEIEQSNKEKESLINDCESLKNEIESMTEELVALDNRSIAQTRTKTRPHK
ncbi:hypothetical protein M9Y10_032765 [Tritrichomonas musculus]|uniref:Uncharacterized protein n=1 Tax=Tritrichomonas musculus TaxID=1915356 RepID=A0ABR2GYI6_9EUKA